MKREEETANPKLYYIQLEDRKCWRLQPRKNVSSSIVFSNREQILVSLEHQVQCMHIQSTNFICIKQRDLHLTLVFLQQVLYVYMRSLENVNDEIKEGNQTILLTVLIVRNFFYLNVCILPRICNCVTHLILFK